VNYRKSCPLHNFVTNYCRGMILFMIVNHYEKVCRMFNSFLSLKVKVSNLGFLMGPLYDELQKVVSAS